MSGTLSESKPKEQRVKRVHIRAAELADWASRPGAVYSGDVQRLIGEVYRLRAKARYQKRRILDLEGEPFERAFRSTASDPPAVPQPDITPAVEETFGK